MREDKRKRVARADLARLKASSARVHKHMDKHDEEVNIPIAREEIHVDTVPIVTGGVRVTKRVSTHDDIIEQELRKSHVDVKRVKADRVVDGPQAPYRNGNTLIVPIVSEVLRLEKQWVVTEEIHIIETEERESVRQRVELRGEQAQIERTDNRGEVVSDRNVTANNVAEREDVHPQRKGLLTRSGPKAVPSRKPLSNARSIVKKSLD